MRSLPRCGKANYGCRMTHDIILPLWKSQFSVTLMVDKKAKRYDISSASFYLRLTFSNSALSLRLFGADITTVGREAKGKTPGDAEPLAEREAVDGDAPEDADTEPVEKMEE